MRHSWRLGLAWAILCTAALVMPSTARGAEPVRGVELEWRAAPGCPDEDWARSAIAAYLGPRARDAFKPIAVRVEITAAARGRFRAALSVTGGVTGNRVFEGAACARVGDAAVLIVALMLDPVQVVTQIDAPRAEPARAEPALTEVDHPQEGPPARVEIFVHAAGDAGSLPEPSVGAGVGAGVRSGPTSFQLDMLAWVPRRAFGGPTAASGGEIGLYSASLRTCFAAMRAIGVVLAPCLRAEAGLSSGTGFGIAEPVTSRNFWGAAFAGVSVRQPSTERLGAWLSLEVGVPFARPNYTIEDFGSVFRAGPLLGRISFGLAWSFP